ncbi:ABC transporter ATP-binding protein [Bauldia sp.]|uniref:ABC transporter ATP-binding protein n=1 Tax=Bauldia sp. TaxID=2575872 RepID=UPI003BA999E4
MPEYVVKSDLLGKSFPGPKRGEENVVFENVNFRLERGEFVTCIGHSGCGKSTILNIIAGLEKPSSGCVLVDGKTIDGPGRDRAVVFQNHSLLPWLSAQRNVDFAVKARWPDWDSDTVRAHSRKYLSLASLSDGLDRKPHALSGGMRQRVGIARAFALETEVLLMDEPFGALDALTRGSIQDELIKIWSETRKTVFMITHDVDEAILLSDRIFLMTNGPRANIAEAVVVDIPRPRNRGDIIHHPGYYDIRNHIIDFLVQRSKELSGNVRSIPLSEVQIEQGLVYPPDVNPLKTDACRSSVRMRA